MDKNNIIHFSNSKNMKENKNELFKSIVDTKVHVGSIVTDNDFKIYKNNYFGFEMKVPNNWITLEHEDLVRFALENFNRLNISDTEKKQMIEAMTTDSISLFSATPFPRGSKQPYGSNQKLDNPSLNCTAQKVIMHPNKTSLDFMEGIVENLKSGNMGFKYDEVSDVHSVIISGKRFDSIEGKAFINAGRDTVHTKCYSTLKKGYQLLIITSSITEEGSKDLDKLVINLVLS
ncbi:hypothetical protein [Bacillus marasmi]|uniref:hypothetical protein n=1 Tax=Bacillus marasmi TaxID=1926279 RepID=UPI0011CB155D|nr:hypothetical protein [Bacillus marasmi]